MPDTDPSAEQQEQASRSARRLAGRIAGDMVRPVLVQLLERPAIRDFVLLYLSNKLSIEESSFPRCRPPYLDKIEGFEDCHWLLNSNKLNHGITRRTIEEAAFLYRLVRHMDRPSVVELGRFRGGGTFLLAAAGAAHVLSLDNDELPGQEDYVRELDEALTHFGLGDRVENVSGDAFTWPCDANAFDLVFCDFATDAEGGQRVVDHWWPAVKPGGYLLMGDGKDSPLEDLAAFVSSLDIAAYGGTRIPDTPGAFVLFRKNT